MATIHVHVHHDYPHSIDRKLDLIMAALEALQAAATRVSSEVQEAIAALEDLKAKLDAGTLQQADIDAITATLTGSADALDTAANAADPQEPPVEPTV